MNNEQILKVLKNERECIARQSRPLGEMPQCRKDDDGVKLCEYCDLCLPDDEILEVYDFLINGYELLQNQGAESYSIRLKEPLSEEEKNKLLGLWGTCEAKATIVADDFEPFKIPDNMRIISKGEIMVINGVVHCLFEQSGTFKNEFIKLGIKAFDYDIQDNFGETDNVIDLFREIDKAYDGGKSVFDEFVPDDLIIAFYPCIYFCATSQMSFFLSYINYRCLSFEERISEILKRSAKREDFYTRLIKLCAVCQTRGLRLIVENPWSEQTYLKANFIKVPDLVDNNRLLRGDYYRKPTAYWFWNCEPTSGFSYQNDKEPKTIMGSREGDQAGLCSTERSMISHDYARNFICDFVLGKPQEMPQVSLFDLLPNDIEGDI